MGENKISGTSGTRHTPGGEEESGKDVKTSL